MCGVNGACAQVTHAFRDYARTTLVVLTSPELLHIFSKEATAATRLNSAIIASSLDPAPDHVLEEDVIISLRHLKVQRVCLVEETNKISERAYVNNA